jgi:predicted nucleic acid-binding protein
MKSFKKAVVDANILLRGIFGKSASDILSRYEDVEFYAPGHCLLEARKNVPTIAKWKQVDAGNAIQLLDQMFDDGMVVLVHHSFYDHLKKQACARVAKHDPKDWPVIATALFLSAPIWTEDKDFFGSGIATWTTDRIEIYFQEV